MSHRIAMMVKLKRLPQWTLMLTIVGHFDLATSTYILVHATEFYTSTVGGQAVADGSHCVAHMLRLRVWQQKNETRNHNENAEKQ